MASYNGVQFELSVRQSSGLAANFHRADRGFDRAMQDVMARGAELIANVTEQLSPKDTLFMSRHVRIFKSASGLVIEVGWDASDFFAIGEAFYPYFQEFGTRKMAAQPSLGPAYDYANPIIRADASDTLRAVIAGLSSSGR